MYHKAYHTCVHIKPTLIPCIFCFTYRRHYPVTWSINEECPPPPPPPPPHSIFSSWCILCVYLIYLSLTACLVDLNWLWYVTADRLNLFHVMNSGSKARHLQFQSWKSYANTFGFTRPQWRISTMWNIEVCSRGIIWYRFFSIIEL